MVKEQIIECANYLKDIKSQVNRGLLPLGLAMSFVDSAQKLADEISRICDEDARKWYGRYGKDEEGE